MIPSQQVSRERKTIVKLEVSKERTALTTIIRDVWSTWVEHKCVPLCTDRKNRKSEPGIYFWCVSNLLNIITGMG